MSTSMSSTKTQVRRGDDDYPTSISSTLTSSTPSSTLPPRPQSPPHPPSLPLPLPLPSIMTSRPAIACDDGVHPSPHARRPSIILRPPRRPPPLLLLNKPILPLSHVNVDVDVLTSTPLKRDTDSTSSDLSIPFPFMVGLSLGATTWIFAIFLFFLPNTHGARTRAFRTGIAIGICMATIIVVLFTLFTFYLNKDVN